MSSESCFNLFGGHHALRTACSCYRRRGRGLCPCVRGQRPPGQKRPACCARAAACGVPATGPLVKLSLCFCGRMRTCMKRQCKEERWRDGLQIVSVDLIAIRVDCGFWSMVFLDILGARQAATASYRHKHDGRGCGPETGSDYAGCGVFHGPVGADVERGRIQPRESANIEWASCLRPIVPRALGGDARPGFRPETRVKGSGLSGYARPGFRPQPVPSV